jgi:aspartyl-tRNA(Asn)/glutamyl-tRNA(Gln) amidotransferase subunit B
MTTTVVRYEPVIGLEVHVQLLTHSKMFCPCPADYSGAAPNSHVCPICMGMPGVLPVINRTAVEYTIMTGLAVNCEIAEFSKFDRKNYPYPDLMKGYQISQYDLPLCVNGSLEIGRPGHERRVGITRIHLEEDTATSKHLDGEDGEGFSLIDVNRAGTPLMEVVGEPDLRSPEEAKHYLEKLQQIVRYIGVSHANPEEGNFRCDANVSLRPEGAREFGTKVEVKNMNSFRAVQRALEFEIARQTQLLERGERIVQETRGWVEPQNRTISQRSKEQAHDYRYFPEPDLPPLVIATAEIELIRAGLPELPDARRVRFERQYGLSLDDAAGLTETRQRADYFEAAVAEATARGAERAVAAKATANWMLNDLARLQHEAREDLEALRFQPEKLAELVRLVESGTITSRAARDVFEEMYRSGRDPKAIVEEQGLTQISDEHAIREAAQRAIDANPKAVADYLGGKQQVMNVLVGRVMGEMRGRANPSSARTAIESLLKNG